MNTIEQLIPQGPWYVCRPLVECFKDGRTHLAHNPSDGWVEINGENPAWCGSHAQAVEIARTHGGAAVPARWVDIRILRRDWRNT
jgi:hypothetical protein